MALNDYMGQNAEEMQHRALMAQMGQQQGAVPQQKPSAFPTPGPAAAPPGPVQPKPGGGIVPPPMPNMGGNEPASAGPYQAKGPAMGLEGFDAGKLADTSHNSPKYVFARAAQGLGVNDKDELLRRLKADPNGYFANASFGGSKGDKLEIGGQLDPSFDGINEFDVVRAAGDGGKGWQWGVDGPPGGGGGGAAHAAPGGNFTDSMGLTQESTFDKLMAMLKGKNGAPGSDPNALMSLMGQQ